MKFIVLVCLFFSKGLFAEEIEQEASTVNGIGEVAGNLLQPVKVLGDFIGSASILIGITILFAALLKYLQYRINPHAMPFSTIITLVIIGILLILLPFTYMLTDSGITYSLFS